MASCGDFMTSLTESLKKRLAFEEERAWKTADVFQATQDKSVNQLLVNMQRAEHARLMGIFAPALDVIAAAEVIKRVYEKREFENFMKDQQEFWAARENMFDALERLREHLKGESL